MKRVPYFNPEHPSEDDDPTDGGKLYRTAKWKKWRRLYLNLYPLCQAEWCEGAGRVELAVTVHHIIEVKEGGAIYSVDNVRGTCLACHNRIHNQRMK